MDAVSKTLYIPLFGKALVSRRGILLEDKKAEQIWDAAGFPLTGKAASKFLAFSMAMRASVFDRWTAQRCGGATVLHLGCGLDDRRGRLGCPAALWYDVDLPEVIRERRSHYTESPNYHMTAADLRETQWLESLPDGRAVVVMEGISMYLRPEELKGLLTALKAHFSSVQLLMDCYSTFAAKTSKYKNPINDVGVTRVYGMDDPKGLAEDTGYAFLGEHSMAPTSLIRQLNTGERILFSNLYAGPAARKLYRIYEFEA